MLANRHGAASIVALLVLSLLLVVGSGLAFLSMTDIKMAGNYRDGVMAQYLAEAGAKRAIAEIRKSGNGEWTGESREFDIGNYGGKSQYEVLPVEKRGIDRIITSTGAVNTSTRKVVVAVSTESPYQYVAYSGDNMNLEGLTISGNIGSNSNIRVSGGAITGSIDAVGNIFTYGVDAPQKKEGVKAIELPSFNPAVRQKYKSTGQNANIFEDNFQRYTFWEDFNSLDNELYYVETRYPLLLSLENIRGPGIIYCTEDILIAGATVANNAILISEKNITVTEGLVDKVFFVAGGDVNISLAQFRGSAVAGGNLSIVLTRNGADKLETIEALTNPLLPSAWVTDKIQIKTWNSYE